MLPLLATHLLKKARWSAPEPLALPAAGLPGLARRKFLGDERIAFFRDFNRYRRGALGSRDERGADQCEPHPCQIQSDQHQRPSFVGGNDPRPALRPC